MLKLSFLTVIVLLPLAAQDAPVASDLLAREADALKSYVSYQYTEETTTKMAGTPVNMTMTSSVQAVNPGKRRMEMKMGSVVASLMVFDGQTAWIYSPMLKQYAKMPNGNDLQGQLDGFGASAMPDFLHATDNAKVVRSESIDVDGVPHECWVVESHVDKMSLGPMELSNATTTVWIDKQLGIGLQRNMSGKMQGGPMPGSMEMETKSVKRGLKFNEALNESLFVFTPPPGAKETPSLLQGLGARTARNPRTPPAITSVPPAAPASAPPANVSNGPQPQAFVPHRNALQRIEPELPDSVEDTGMVQLLVTIDAQGSVLKAEALSGPQPLRQPSINAVRQQKYRPVIRNGRPVVAYIEESETFSNRKKPITAADFNMDEQMAATERTQELQSQFPRSPQQVLDDLEQDLGDAKDPERSFALPELAKAAIAAGALDKAALYASEMLSSAAQGNWNDGNAVHDGNMIRGLIALKSGNVKQAAHDLVEAGKTRGSPQLNSFGPNLTLADELLQAGERDAVVEYLTLCKKFWTMGTERLDSWITTIQAGGSPDFRMNLMY